MRHAIIPAAVAALALAGCGVKYGEQDGWTTLTVPGVPPSLQYEIPAGGRFVALCEPNEGVTFSLLGGGNRRTVEQFTVTSGGWHHDFETYGTKQDTGLVMLPSGATGSPEEAADRRAIAQALAATKAPIVFSAEGGWSRTIPASDKIGTFVANCNAGAKPAKPS